MNCMPSEPFLSKYLIENKNLTKEELNTNVWPVDTYGSFIFLIPIIIIAESIG